MSRKDTMITYEPKSRKERAVIEMVEEEAAEGISWYRKNWPRLSSELS